MPRAWLARKPHASISVASCAYRHSSESLIRCAGGGRERDPLVEDALVLLEREVADGQLAAGAELR